MMGMLARLANLDFHAAHIDCRHHHHTTTPTGLVPSLMGLKDNLKTPVGRLQWMLEIIKASLDKRPRDDVLILDCLFALMYVSSTPLGA